MSYILQGSLNGCRAYTGMVEVCFLLRSDLTGENKLWSSLEVCFNWFLQSLRSSLTYLSGASGIGELIANTLAVRNVTTIVLDVKPIVTENCETTCAINNEHRRSSALQTISHFINAMCQSGKRLRLFLK